MAQNANDPPATISVARNEAEDEKGTSAMKVQISALQDALVNAKKELSLKVKHYETKLVTMTVINGALQIENDKLKEEIQAMGDGRQAGAAQAQQLEQEMKELQEEFTKRLGVAEKTASVMKEECFSLRQQMEATKKAMEKTEALVQEQTQLVEQYKAEGEALAKKNGDLESLLRKVRAEAQKLEQERDKLVARVQVLEAAAKSDEVSRSGALEEANQALNVLRQSMTEQKQQFTELLEAAERKRESDMEGLRQQHEQEREKLLQQVEEREQLLSSTLEGQRQQLSQANEDGFVREEKLKRELAAMEERCRVYEQAQEDVSSSLTDATRPLIRQMESLAAQVRQSEVLVEEKERQWQKERAELLSALGASREGQRKAETSAIACERREEAAARTAREAKERSAAVATQLRELQNEMQVLTRRWEEAEERANAAEESVRGMMLALSAARLAKEEVERSLRVLQAEGNNEGEKKEQERHQSSTAHKHESRNGMSREEHNSNNFVTSLSAAADKPPHDSAAMANGEKEEDHDTVRQASGGLLEEVGGAAAGAVHFPGGGPLAMERMAARIRQQQGEIAQLQRELAGANSQCEHVTKELLKVSEQLHVLEQGNLRAPEIQKELEELRERHDMALIIIGERNERAEELEADMADVKALYREQINLLVNQVDPQKWPQGYRICLFCSHCAQTQRNKKK